MSFRCRWRKACGPAEVIRAAAGRTPTSKIWSVVAQEAKTHKGGALTLDNLKQALPDNHRFHDSLDMTFGAGQSLAEYDEFHKMFKVNRLLIASREQQP
jgi:hypothetical protein